MAWISLILYAADYNANTAGNWDDPEHCPGNKPIGPIVNEALECDAQLEQRQGGNKALKPEKTNQWTLSVILEPANFVSLGFDFWGINRKDTISSLSDKTLFGSYAKYKAAGFFPRTNCAKYGVPRQRGNLAQLIMLKPKRKIWARQKQLVLICRLTSASQKAI